MSQEEKLTIVFIINPISGTKDKKDLPDLIQRHLDLNKFDFEILYTEYAGHAEKLAHQCVEKKINIVVAVGGDGTINEVGRSLVETDTALSILPYGSGNGLARHLNIPLNIADAIQSFNSSSFHKIDYCKANEYIFFCTCGVGFDAHIGHVFSQQKTRGFWTYFKSVLKEFFAYRSRKYTLITENGKIKRRAFLITFANAAQYGNNAYIAPHADIQDGMLDVSILEQFPIYSVPFLGIKLFSKNINKSKHVYIFKTSKVLVKRKKKGIFHFDGEPVKAGKKIEVKVINKGLNVFIPREPKNLGF